MKKSGIDKLRREFKTKKWIEHNPISGLVWVNKENGLAPYNDVFEIKDKRGPEPITLNYN